MPVSASDGMNRCPVRNHVVSPSLAHAAIRAVFARWHWSHAGRPWNPHAKQTTRRTDSDFRCESGDFLTRPFPPHIPRIARARRPTNRWTCLLTGTASGWWSTGLAGLW